MNSFFQEQWFPIILFVISIWINYWCWKNPMSDDLKKRRSFEDSDGTLYLAGIKSDGWIVKKTQSDNIERSLPFQWIANKKNNPTVDAVPNTLDELKKLKYEEI